MERPYTGKRAGAEAKAFTGKELLDTKAKGLPTLFVVGKKTVGEISDMLDTCSGIKHVSFGANGSFTGEDLPAWTNTIRFFLREGMWCTLDFRAGQMSLVQKTGLCRQARFIPLLRVALPSVLRLGANAVLKLDDVCFAGTNPGIWSSPLNTATLLAPKALVPWQMFEQDDLL